MTLVHHPMLPPTSIQTVPYPHHLTCLPALPFTQDPSFFLQSTLLPLKQYIYLLQHFFSPWDLSFSHQHQNSTSSLSHSLFLFLLFNPDCPSSRQPVAKNPRAHNIPANYPSQPNTDWVFPVTHHTVHPTQLPVFFQSLSTLSQSWPSLNTQPLHPGSLCHD